MVDERFTVIYTELASVPKFHLTAGAKKHGVNDAACNVSFSGSLGR